MADTVYELLVGIGQLTVIALVFALGAVGYYALKHAFFGKDK